jgi:hypothetical protein
MEALFLLPPDGGRPTLSGMNAPIAERCLSLPAVLAAALLAACGSSVPPVAHQAGDDLPPGPVSCPVAGDLSAAGGILPERLADEATLRRWQEYMVGLGPRFTGSPAHKEFHEFLVSELEAVGFTVTREPRPIHWWLHRKWSLKLVENGVETELPVAAYYPYSGSTPEGGFVAELADAGRGLPQDFAAGDFDGKIAFYEEDMLPANASIFYAAATYVHDPDQTLTPATPYKRASLSFLTPQESIATSQQGSSLASARTAGALGSIVSYEASFDNAAGQYTPFLSSPSDLREVPTLYVDRATGNLIKAKIALGASARLELVVDKHPDDFTDDLIAWLPGRTDEVLILNTHTDGTSASQENGNLGILSLARYFGALPQNCRQRTIAIALIPGHFHNGFEGDTEGFIDRNPEIIARSVGSLTLEHLGQTEWVDDVVGGFHPTGMVEPAAWFGSASTIQAVMTNAVIAEDLRRTFVMRPYGVIYFGVGSPLNAAGVPNAAFITGPNSMLSWANNQHLDKVDYGRMAAEIRTAARIFADLDALPTEQLCAGLYSQSGMATGCNP